MFGTYGSGGFSLFWVFRVKILVHSHLVLWFHLVLIVFELFNHPDSAPYSHLLAARLGRRLLATRLSAVLSATRLGRILDHASLGLTLGHMFWSYSRLHVAIGPTTIV